MVEHWRTVKAEMASAMVNLSEFGRRMFAFDNSAFAERYRPVPRGEVAFRRMV